MDNNPGDAQIECTYINIIISSTLFFCQLCCLKIDSNTIKTQVTLREKKLLQQEYHFIFPSLTCRDDRSPCASGIDHVARSHTGLRKANSAGVENRAARKHRA